MANQIRITPDQMRQRANDYRREADTVNGVIVKMDSLLQQLQNEWEGSASESYVARYQELKPGFVKAEELIREIATALDSTARIVEQTDSEIVKKARDSKHLIFFDDMQNMKIVDMPLAVARNYKKPIELGDCYYIKDNECVKIKSALIL